MYGVLARFAALFFYLIILLASVDFDIQMLWSAKSLLLVLLGTLLLTASGCRKGMGREEVRNSVCINAMTAGYLATFIELFGRLSGNLNGYEETMKAIAISCRAILYGFIINVILKQTVTPEEEIDRSSGTSSNALEKETESTPDREIDQDYFRALGLTQREAEIVQLVRLNMTNKEIAEKLFISETTVKKHLSNIFKKLEISGREELRWKIFMPV